MEDQIIDSIQASTVPTNYASFLQRLVAIIIDGIFISTIVLVLGYLLGLDLQGPIQNAISIFINWGYFAGMESSPGQATLGKKAMGLRVVDINGDQLSFWNATGRYFSKIISALILLIGFFMAAFTEKKQALHDIIAGTLVIKS
jgi:uncharacterized RDD family membrane protein YckC